MLSLYRPKPPENLLTVCREGNVARVKSLLKQKADPNHTGTITPLHIACSRQHSEMVRLLLRHKAAVNQRDNFDFTPLHRACCTGNIQIIGMLLKAKADVTLKVEGQTALQMALAQGSTFIPCLLLYGTPALQN